MKVIQLIAASWIICTSLSAQDNLPSVAGVSSNIIGHTAFAEAYDEKGKPLTEVNKTVTGTPMLSDEWGKGQVKFRNAFVLRDVELKFDVFSNKLYFQKDNTGYAFVDTILEFTIAFSNHDGLQSVKFRSGYPAIKKKNDLSFYKVIADGSKLQLLNYVAKEVRENYDYLGPLKKAYEITDNYYIYDQTSKAIKSVNNNKASFIKALPAYADKIAEFAEDNNFDLKSEAQMTALFKMLNAQ